MKTVKEDLIRDHLVENLDFIEQGLILIQKEHYLPNDKGAAGFVDILCRTEDGKLLIIEIKRSDSSARETLHELSKYVALLKDQKLLKNSDIRLAVISTSWHELRVPFAEFQDAERYDCSGYEIEVDDIGAITSIEKIKPLPMSTPRKICCRQWFWEFQSFENAKNSIETLARLFEEIGLRDFVLICVDLKERNMEIEALVYFAQQEESFEFYMEIIKKRTSHEELEEFMEWISDFSEENDRIEEAADKCWENLNERELINPRSQQISNPEKAKYWLNDEMSKKIEIFRYGRFDDETLKDEIILKDITGDSGTSRFFINEIVKLTSNPELKELTEAIETVFYSNEVWKNHLLGLIRYSKAIEADSMYLQAFNNDDIMTTIAGVAFGEYQYTPTFKVEIQKNEKTEIFAGVIEWDGTNPDFSEILCRYFQNDPFTIMMAQHFGENRLINEELSSDLGLRYIMLQFIDEEEPEKVKIRGNSVVPEIKSVQKTFLDFFKENQDFVLEVAAIFAEMNSDFNKYALNKFNEH